MSYDELFRTWAIARHNRLLVQREMVACGRCEQMEPADHEVGDPGRARCWQMWSHVTDDWCEPCKKRQPLYERKRALKRTEKAAFYRLCAWLNRHVDLWPVEIDG